MSEREIELLARFAELEAKLELAETDAERAEIKAELVAGREQVDSLHHVESTAVEESRPASTDLDVRPDVPDDVFRAMDALDEAQILDALQGRPSEVMVYSFASGGKTQTGLSYAGVAECVRTINTKGYAAIRVSPSPPVVEEVTETDENDAVVTYYRVTVYAEDTLNGGGQWGLATQPKFQTYRAGKKPTLDKFALTKALSKAQRNAMLPMVPVEYREVVIAQALKDEARVRQIKAGGAGDLAEMPPPLVDERAEAQKESARTIYRELQDANRLAILPAAFHAYLSRAEHSHERLDEFIGYLEQKLAEEKAKAPA